MGQYDAIKRFSERFENGIRDMSRENDKRSDS